MKHKQYNREKAVQYATKWAMDRNPKYYNFDNVGGDCTSFISQVIFAGSGVMNYNTNGWYYRNGNDKAPAWSGVEYLYKFLINNKGIGPCGREISMKEVEIGDIAQLSFNGIKYHHSLAIIDVPKSVKEYKDIKIATHTEDAYNRRLSTYTFYKIRFIKIEQVNII